MHVVVGTFSLWSMAAYLYTLEESGDLDESGNPRCLYREMNLAMRNDDDSLMLWASYIACLFFGGCELGLAGNGLRTGCGRAVDGLCAGCGLAARTENSRNVSRCGAYTASLCPDSLLPAAKQTTYRGFAMDKSLAARCR